MISFEKAIEIVLGSAPEINHVSVPLEKSLGMVLSKDIVSDVNIPPADMSAMDGYACRFSERSMPLLVLESIAAGTVFQKAIVSGTCSRIMTGAMVPSGADCVVMFEHTMESDGIVTVTKMTNSKNIRYKAEDTPSGTVILNKGTVISAATFAVLATVGIKKNVPVARQPHVGIIATGNELIEPDLLPSGPQIRNSNSYQLYAQTLRCGCKPECFGIAEDNVDSTRKLIEVSVAQSDVILISGGVSTGDFDCVPAALKDCGFDLLIESIAIKPGKPTIFGTNGEKYVFGMPGNPVSSFVLFELLVRPFLQKMMGHSYSPLIIRAPLAKKIIIKKSDRVEIVPVKFTPDGCVEKIEYHGSAHIHAYTNAHGFLILDKNTEMVDASTMVNVQLIEK